MEHRDKRQRLSDAEDPVYNPAGKTPSTEPLPAPSTIVEDGTVTALGTISETAQDRSEPISPEPSRTPDKSTWQGWAEIENDPVYSPLCNFQITPLGDFLI